ncbi:MAG TPA: hypothetical protein VGE74_05100 [Gemmata sp.]
MAKSRKEKSKQEPPVAFRPGPELEHLVSAFASQRRIGVNEAYKHLAALAVVGLDGGYYDLLAQLAARMTGQNTFVRAAVQIHTALLAAVRVDPAHGREPQRMRFVIETVLEQVPGADEQGLREAVAPLFVRLPPAVPTSTTEVGGTEAEHSVQPVLDQLKIRVVQED